jgi:hypothetical protein
MFSYLILLFLTSYHHVLKDYHLDGKRNRRVDHLIHTLVKEMLPTYEDRHKRQQLGMQGPDLAEKRRKQILKRVPETPLDRIKKIDDSRFEIQSTSSGKKYEVNLLAYTCTCLDFPRIELCKHVAATVHFFGGGLEGAGLGPPAPVNASASGAQPDAPNSPAPQNGSAVGSKIRAAIDSDLRDIERLQRELFENMPANPDPETAKSIKLARSQLNAVRLSMNDNESRLPEIEHFGPNQLSWPPTAARMGVKKGDKRRGKVDSALTAEHIGAPKHKRPNDDPYGAGEESGKRAKPDAVSAAANTRARAKAERPPPASLPTRLPSPSPASHTTLHPSPVPGPAHFAQSQPHPMHFPIPPTYSFQYPPTYYHYPMYSPYTFPPPT